MSNKVELQEFRYITTEMSDQLENLSNKFTSPCMRRFMSIIKSQLITVKKKSESVQVFLTRFLHTSPWGGGGRKAHLAQLDDQGEGDAGIPHSLRIRAPGTRRQHV